MFNKIKKLCLSLAMVSVVGVSAAASACTIQSAHPAVRITIEFNSEIYEIEYTLYRNMYPQTVKHFIELTEAHFYDNVIIHEYKSSDWVTGAYSYDKEAYKSMYTSAMSEYLERYCKESDYNVLASEGIKNGTFSPSVYKDEIFDDGKISVSSDSALNTLIGEFSDNGHRIEDDKGLRAGYGTLKMVYYAKKGNKLVSVKDSFDAIRYGNYGNNCATSLFSMQVSNSTLYDANKYCVFGQFRNEKAKSALEDLTDAISDYSDKLGSSSSLTKSVSTQVDKEDSFASEEDRGIDTSFTMISMPIVITKIEVIKY